MPLDLDSLSSVVAMAVNDAVAPLKEKLALAEAKIADLLSTRQDVTVLRERVVAAETKAALLHTPPSVDLAPVVERLTLLEAKSAAVADAGSLNALAQRVDVIEAKALPEPEVSVADVHALRDRVVVIETKAALLEARLSEPAPLSAAIDRTDRLVADLTKELGAVRERVAVAEVRQLVPGPAGKDGKDGQDGIGWGDLAVVQEDDTRTFTFKGEREGRVKTFGTFVIPAEIYRGVWAESQGYVKGDCVTRAGSEWHCNEPTITKPGDGSKAWTLKVKRGRDGKDGRDAAGALPVVSVGGKA